MDSLIFKIEGAPVLATCDMLICECERLGIKLQLEKPPKAGKISVTLQAKRNSMVDRKDSVVESKYQKVNSKMEWKMNTIM